ncbi:MAG: redoxin domain-containing protein [Candidatus Poribacteria bacterium]|nr:redoxin domain-containing protein [Candidatus Poribacteria bacterium]
MTLNLLFTSVISTVAENETHVPKIRVDLADESLLTGQESQNLKTCTQNLVAIGKALQTYKKEHGDFPQWLSELHPKYLTNPDALICPADEDQGVPILTYNTDPNLPVSYNYDCDPEYYRQWLKHERHVYNGANPIVRCPHHANLDVDSTLISKLYLNLSFSNDVYLSNAFWYKHPIKMYGSLQAAIAEYERALQLVPDDPNFFTLYPELLRLYMEAKQEKDVENIIKNFKSVMKPHGEDIMRFRDYWTFVEMLKIVGKHEEALQLLQHLEKTEKENPFIRSIFREIAMIHEEKGNVELASTYFLKADARLGMIGKPAPNFSATDIDGNPISLKDYHGKVVLLDFWTTTCGPCIAEMPNMKKVYDAYKDVGFDVIGINIDADEADLHEFLKACDLPWRQIFGGQDSPLKKLYRVLGVPSPWLMNREGNVISYQARGAALKKLVAEAVREES